MPSYGSGGSGSLGNRSGGSSGPQSAISSISVGPQGGFQAAEISPVSSYSCSLKDLSLHDDNISKLLSFFRKQ